MNLSCVAFKVNLINNLSSGGLILMLQDLYIPTRGYFSLTKKIDGENLYMRNSSTSKVLDVGKVILKMTSKKLLTFNNILHVSNIRKKLVFGSL
jgi:hypothetical protein